MRPDPKITPKFVVAVVEQAREIATNEAPMRIPPRLGLAVVLASVTLIGWGLMRSTWAQDQPAPTAPALPQTHAEPTKPMPVPESAATVGTTPPPLATDSLLEATVPELTKSSTIEPSSGASQATHRQFSEIPPTPPGPPASENEDPEKTVQAFVEQNRKVAEGQLKNLKDEEAKLRARLQKVEGGIKRWEALLAALEKSKLTSSSKGLSLTDPRVPRSVAPGSIDPPGPPEVSVERSGDQLTDSLPPAPDATPKPPAPR